MSRADILEKMGKRNKGVASLLDSCLIAVLTSAVGSASKLCLVVVFTVSGQAPCSGAKRRSKGLDEVSTAILGDAVAENE